MVGSSKRTIAHACGVGVLLYLVIFQTLLAATATTSKNNKNSYRYVLNLESTFEQASKAWLPEIASLKQYALYTVQYQHKGKQWYRLRLGFFTSRNNANTVLKTLKPYYPGVWVDRIGADEFSRMKDWEKTIKDKAELIADDKKEVDYLLPELPEVKKIEPKQEPAKPQKITLSRRTDEQIMELAKRALAEKRYRDAVQYYTQVLSGGDDEFKQEALEFLGLAREKNGQLAHAKAEYKKYLELYKEGEGVERVKQRLLALLTARDDPKKITEDKKKEDDVFWSSFGSISQFIRHDASEADGVTIEDQSLASDVVFSARRRSNKYDIKTFMSANHFYDIDDPDNNTSSKVSSLYAELIERQGAYSAKLGRFTQNSDGVLGRMDGVAGSVGINEKWKLNAVAGYPVELITSNISDKNKPFYGVGFSAGTFSQKWDYSFYYFTRDVESLTDRQAIGGELRFLGDTQTAFALLDYDTYFSKLNNLFVVSNWRLPQDSLVNLTLNYRMSPLLMTTSALQGQGTTSIDTLLQSRTPEEIKQLALDRTAVYKSLTLSGNKGLNEKYSLNGEVTVSNLSGTPASGGVEATLSTGNEFYYGIQLIGVNLYSKFDTSVGELRYEDTSNYQKTKLTASTRWRGKDKWSFRPRLSYEIRDNVDGSEAEKIVPSIRVDYRYSKKVKFEFEMQYEDITKQTTVKSKESNYSISAGYIYDFF